MSPAEILDMYRAHMADQEDVIIRRFSGTGEARSKIEASVKARVAGYAPKDLIGSIVQGDRKIIALNDPEAMTTDGMVSLSSLLPLTNNDKVVVRGKELSIKSADDSTRRFKGVLIALEIQVAG